MKKTFLPVAGPGLLLIVILFSNSCHKTDLPGADPRNGNTDFRQCVIQKIGDGTDLPYSRRLTITYNSKRDPVIAEPAFISTGSPRWMFYYDKKGRLKTFAGVYENGIFEFWHNYYYDNQDRIVSDTVYFFGVIGQEGSTTGWRHYHLFYDHLNRIIRQDITTAFPLSEPPYTGTFTYNAAGNLDGDVNPYDENVNPLLTNKIWRFLARDYSINNLGHATAYNEKGLPLHFDNYNGGGAYGGLWNIYNPNIDIQYDCHGDTHGGHY